MMRFAMYPAVYLPVKLTVNCHLVSHGGVSTVHRVQQITAFCFARLSVVLSFLITPPLSLSESPTLFVCLPLAILLIWPLSES